MIFVDIPGVGNGANDRLMLKEAAIGITVLQEEGLAVSSLLEADLKGKSLWIG
ncbi:MAG: hypothetical protein WC836_16810 [Desulfobacula sp.]|jgi:soluble P-type ATPase